MKRQRHFFLARAAMTLLVTMLTTIGTWSADITQNTAVVINSSNKATYHNKSITGTVPSDSKAGTSDSFTSFGAIVVDGIDLNLTIEDFTAVYSDGGSYRSGIALKNGATLHLTVLGTNTLQGDFGGAGIAVPAGCTLEITAASTGTLNATGGKSFGGGAGIGSLGDHANTQTQAFGIIPQGLGDIIINGGTINAKGGTWYVYFDKAGGAAGIGSGEYSGMTDPQSVFGDNTYINNITGSITINGGTVTASGGYGGTGIGGGNCGTVKTITITGGTVTANGNSAAAIGCGYNSQLDKQSLTCPTINLTGGTITANGNIGYSKEILAGHNVGGKVTIGADADVRCTGSIQPFDAATIPTNSYIDGNGQRQTAQNPSSVYNIETWDSGWWVVDKYIEINNRVVVNGTVNLIVNDGVILNAKKGIQVHRGNTLNIYTQLSGTGLIKATGDSGNSGIGGGYIKGRSGTFEDKSCGTINIYGGTIEAKGGSSGAGIGSGYVKSETTDGGTINIYGGTVTAWGNDCAAGIGSGEISDAGKFSNPQTVHIYGGRVTAYNGGGGSAGIGKGRHGKNGEITLSWTNSTDAIYANGYGGNVTLDKEFVLENTETIATSSNISGKTLVPPLTISFNAGGGSGVMADIKTSYGYNYALPVCTFTSPIDKEFFQWYVDEKAYNEGDEITITGNTTITAMWKEAPRTVQFNLNGHGEAIDNQTVPYDDNATEPDTPTADGYTFGGWYKEQSCANRWNFATEHVTKHTTLYAKWSQNAYTIAYNLNGGVETTSNPLSYMIEDNDIILAAPVKTGYNFAGWTYEGQDEPVMSVTIPHGTTGNKSYTAHWQIAQFTIFFDTGEGGPAVEPITQDYNSEVSVPAVTIKKAKYIFIGWQDFPNRMPAEDTTIEANWARVSPVEAREATCNEDGMIACYYALCHYYREEADGITYTQLTPAEYKTPATGHDWIDPTWTWDNNNFDGMLMATLQLTCSKCHYIDRSNCTTFETEVTTEPTIDADGVLTYTARLEVYGTQYSDTYEETIPRTGVAAKIDDTEYPYIETALAAAQNGDVVTVCQDVDDLNKTYGTPSPYYKDVTLDLNGHSVHVQGICMAGDLTIKNGTFTGRVNNFNTGNNNTLTLDNTILNCEGLYHSLSDTWDTCIEWLATNIAVTNSSVMYICGSTYLGGGADDGFNLAIDETSTIVLSNATLSGYNEHRVRSEFAKYLPAGYTINSSGKVEYNNSEYYDFLTLQPVTATTLNAHLANGNYWTTYYNSATGFKIDNEENACAYTATYAAGTLTLHKLGKVIPAGTAVVIVGEDSSISMTASNEDAEHSVSDDLRGTDVATSIYSIGDGTFYVLGNKNSHFGFHLFSGTTMAARKAFLFIPDVYSAPSLNIVFEDETTGVRPPSISPSGKNTEASARGGLVGVSWYTIDGRKLLSKPTQKGMYIVNGRKVVIN